MIEFLAVVAASGLELRLKQGDAFSQSAVYRYIDAEDDLTLELRYRRVSTVMQTGTQFTIEVADWLLDTIMDGTSIQSSPDKKPLKLKRDLGPDGTLLFQQPATVDPTDNERLARALSIALPRKEVKPGAAWTATYPAGKLPASKGVYRLVATQKVEFDFVETTGANPMRLKGSAHLDARSGWPLRLSGDVENVKIPGGDGRLVRLHVEVAPTG